MMIAIQFNRTKVVKALVQNGAKPDYRNEVVICSLTVFTICYIHTHLVWCVMH